MWKCPIEQWAHELHCGIPVEQNNPGYLKEFLVNYCLFSRSIIKHDNGLLQFTRARLITIYDNVLLQFTIAWLLQFTTTVITIHNRTELLRGWIFLLWTGDVLHYALLARLSKMRSNTLQLQISEPGFSLLLDRRWKNQTVQFLFCWENHWLRFVYVEVYTETLSGLFPFFLWKAFETH